jgi:hypothetical protein
MKFADLSGAAKGAAILAILSLVFGINFTSTTSINGAVTCSYFDIGKVGLGALAAVVGFGGAMRARKDISVARTMNMVVPGIAALVGVFSVLVGFGIILSPC